MRDRMPKGVISGTVKIVLLTMACLKSFAVTPGSLTLAWDPSTDPSVVGYRLYEGFASQSFTNVIDVGSNLQITVSGLISGATYYFAVTAYDGTGLESAFSGQISYTVPASSPGPSPIASLMILKNDLDQAILSGSGPIGYVFDVCATMDLSSWLVIGTVTVDATGLFQFTDQLSGEIPWRFYRLRQHLASANSF